MPIRKDGTGKRWVEIEWIVPGTPEQVWHAMATGPGNAGWFVKAEIEPKEGGDMHFDFGQGAISRGSVTAWEPPSRFGYEERDWSPGAPPVATEITITGRSGGQSVVRMVHSLFSASDEWDDQMEGFESGWPGFFAVLRVYLAHFAGARAASFITMMPASGDSLSVWRHLCEALGLAGASVGERRATSSGPEAWSGVIELVHQDAQQRYVLLRLDAPGPGIALVGTYDKGATSHGAAGPSTNVSLCRYSYGEDAEALVAASEPRWREWLSKTFGVE
jgi:uncharacterized protein YndB with AHSA1/START domain